MKTMRQGLLCTFAVAGLFTTPALAQSVSIFNDRFDYGTAGTVSFSNEVVYSPPSSTKSNPAADTQGWGAINRTFPAADSGEATIRFYDDMGGCWDGNSKTQVVFVQTQSGGASTRLIGVDTYSAPCAYIFRSGYSYSTTNITRSPGWHHMRFSWGSGQLTITIDGQTVSSTGYAYQPTVISFGDVWSYGAIGPAWYDDLQVTTVSF